MPAFPPPLCRCATGPLAGLVVLPNAVAASHLLRRCERLLAGANQAMRFGRLPRWARAAARCAPAGFQRRYDQLIVNAYEPGEAQRS